MKVSLTPLAVLFGLTIHVSAQTLPNYQATVSSQGPTAYFKLDSSLVSAVNGGVFLESFGGGYASDVYRNPTNSFFFVNSTEFLRNLTDNLISGGGVTNTTSTNSGSITLLFRSLSAITNTGQRFLLYAGNTTADGNALSLFLENNNPLNGDTNSLKLRFGNSTTTLLQATNIVPSTWYYFALTYVESRSPDKARWYLGRAGDVLTSGSTTNAADAVAGDGTGIYIGNQTNLTSGYRNTSDPGRVDEVAIWNRELSSTEVSNQFVKLPQLAPSTATYEQVVASQIPSYFFELNNSLTNSIGPALTLSTNGTTGAFTTNLLGLANSAYSFSETNDALLTTNDLINGGGPGLNASATGVGSVSFLFRMLSDTNNTGQRFLFSQGSGTSGNKNQLSLFLENTNIANGSPNSLKLRVGNGPTTVVLANALLVPNAWYYFAMTWDETRNSANGGEVQFYIGKTGGALTHGAIDIANDAVVGDGGTVFLCNRDLLNAAFRNPGSGAIDDFAVWNEELSSAEVAAQFNSATNTTPVTTPPTLSITTSGVNAIVSWPATTSSSYLLETNGVIVGGVWTGAGTPSVAGTNYVITNVISGTVFYRLHKP